MNRSVGVGWFAVALVGATFVFAVWLSMPVILLAAGAPEGREKADEASSTERFEAALRTYTARFDGRYLFFEPPPPRPPERPIVREEPDDRPPPAPSYYGGPKIVAMFADEVWFADGRRLRVGGEVDGSLRVVSLDCPWSAEVEWKGAAFTVKFFERDKVVRRATPAGPEGAPAEDDEGAEDAQAAVEPEPGGDEAAADPDEATDATEAKTETEAGENAPATPGEDDTTAPTTTPTTTPETQQQ